MNNNQELLFISTDTDVQTTANKLTKKNAEKAALQIIENINEGFADEVKTYAQANYLENMAKTIKDNLKSKIHTIAISEYKGTIEKYGIAIKMTERKTCTNFSQDPHWRKLAKQMEEVKQAMKDREAYLLSIKANKIADAFGGEVTEYPTTVDPDTGEQVTLMPPVFEYTTYPTVTELK
jgi:hypothetical protein